MGELTELIRSERLVLADFLETLTPDEWATPSLCGEWRVQDVAAHLTFAPVVPRGEMLGGLLRYGFRVNKASAEVSKKWAQRGPAEIIQQLRTNAAAGAKPAGVPEIAALVDTVVHSLDIRVPLGKLRTIPPEVFAPVADFSVSIRWPMTISVGRNARKRLQGLRLVADDYDWSYGEGAQVNASGVTVLRVLNGRPVARTELTGPGADQLYAAQPKG
ncbi:maleylpyruvate isomerase family mycothiol-dependent enzyme [Kribbella sp. NPDC006257]|uniref:maleylpyruvate isomerase family mycothiol-dependent enzyme n=1 Tax=Kribbella sp. NPDC006257 TaxID=3156738 RepID=UPI0033A06E9B